MNKLYYKIFIALFLAFAITGCKLDAPVYPEGTVANPNVDDNGNNNGGDSGIGLPIGASGSVLIKVDDGNLITYNTYSTFNVAPPGSADAPDSAIGFTSVASLKGADFFALISESITTGTFDILDLSFDKYSTVTHSDGSGKGQVKYTLLTSSQAQGSFKSDLVDDQGVTHHVIGSFNVKK